jgi:hypothetical protein
VNDFLQSGSPEQSEEREHAARMERWLATLEAQLSSLLPVAHRANVPDISLTRRWVEALAERALEAVDHDLSTVGTLRFATAWLVEEALLAAFITGTWLPPFRLHILKTLVHPRYNGRIACQDPDCRLANCGGNRVELVEGAGPFEEDSGDEWHYNYSTSSVRSVVVHHKNDRRSHAAPLEYLFPRGSVTKLLLAHIHHGQTVLTLATRERMVRLFVKRTGGEFSDATFVHFWAKLMKSHDTLGQVGHTWGGGESDMTT